MKPEMKINEKKIQKKSKKMNTSLKMKGLTQQEINENLNRLMNM